VLSGFRSFGSRPLVVEGAGGLFVPLDERHDVIDLVVALALPVVLVARAGLGTLNHTALSLEALERRGARVAAVVLSQGTAGRDASVKDNADWIRRRHGVKVLGPVPFLANPVRRLAAFRRVLEEVCFQGDRSHHA
jgi:dethiobiotin synthetase